MSKRTVTVTTYVICNGAGAKKTEPTRDYAEEREDGK